jgi:hypothetical protein
MTQRVVFHELAEDELNEAAEYYETQIRGPGVAFLSEVQHSIITQLDKATVF